MKRGSEISKRRKVSPISEEMREWSAALGRELSRWPGVTSRAMFGFTGFYREGGIFAALPRTRSFGTHASLIFRFDAIPPKLLERAKRDVRVQWEDPASAPHWYSFELNEAKDLEDALWWLTRAYEEAKTKPGPRRRAMR